MTKDAIATLAERICKERPTTLQVRLLLEQALDKDEADREVTYTEQRVKELERQLENASIAMCGYAEEASKGADTCEHCRLILARFQVPQGKTAET